MTAHAVEAALILFAFAAVWRFAQDEALPRPTASEGKQNYNPLTPEERAVMECAATEAPFTGEYYDHFEPGVYACKRCDAVLFRSTDKFRSHCGWPSFDDAVPGAVARRPDPDGRRVEIVCARCAGHLGHVFEGEGLTPKNTRYCVNSLALRFIPRAGCARAIFAGGCFWGVQYVFDRAPGVVSTTAGYAGGHAERPTYEQVCSGRTGHAEAVEVVYDPTRTSFEALARLFFETHDPTQVNRQGPDVGEPYRSAVFYLDDAQRRVAEKLVKELEAKGLRVATQITPAGEFWPAEEYHQHYYDKAKASGCDRGADE